MKLSIISWFILVCIFAPRTRGDVQSSVPRKPPVVLAYSTSDTSALQVNDLVFNALATDSDGTIVQVEFLFDEVSVAVDIDPPYGVVLPAVPAGLHTLQAIGTDNDGLSTASVITVNVVPLLPSLIPFGSKWRYLDDGSDQGTAWALPGFADDGWFSGIGELGFGDYDEATLISQAGSTGQSNTTTYFRHTFDVPAPGAISNLVLRLLRDDGAVVYLNGMEILRHNLGDDEINYQTRAVLLIEDRLFVVANVDPTRLVTGQNTVAVEMHQFHPLSSDMSFDLQLMANVPPQAPIVQLLVTNLFSPANVAINAVAYDLDGVIDHVRVWFDGMLVGSDQTAPYTFALKDVRIGPHLVQALATDNNGLTSTTAVTVVVLPGSLYFPLVETNSWWRYLEDGSDQGTAWRLLDFDDAAWLSGQAELGFGDGDEVTVLRQTTNITYYFRHEFAVANPAVYTNLVLGLRRDDGGVVYLNGLEVFRSNMTNGPGIPIRFNDTAGILVGLETTFNYTNLHPAVLEEGRNVIAVEIHQYKFNPTDLTFELQLLGQRPVGPSLSIAYEGLSVVLSWFPESAGVILEEASSVTGPWRTRLNQTNPQVLSQGDATGFFRLCSDCL